MDDDEPYTVYETQSERDQRIAREERLYQWRKGASRTRAKGRKRDILYRANGQCEVCAFAFSSVLNVHHIEPVHLGGSAAARNLIALCPNCHALVHRYGKRPARDARTLDLQAHHLTEHGYTFRQAKTLLLIASQKARVTADGSIIPHERPFDATRYVLVEDLQNVGESTTNDNGTSRAT